jgi:hypothetical protein
MKMKLSNETEMKMFPFLCLEDIAMRNIIIQVTDTSLSQPFHNINKENSQAHFGDIIFLRSE